MILAHDVGIGSDLPLPLWFFLDAAAVALVLAFILLGTLWHRPRLASAAEGRSLEILVWARSTVSVIVRTAGFALYALILAAAFAGSEVAVSNPAPRWFYVVFWVGMPVFSAVFGDLWRMLSPFDTLAALAQTVRGRRPKGTPEAPAGNFSHWPALVGIGGFLWLELAYHDSNSPRVIGTFLALYSVFVLASTARWGRAWLRTGEGFTVLFSLLADISPLSMREGRLHLRAPFAGLAGRPRRDGTLAVVLLVLGGTAFDGFSATTYWQDVVVDSTGWTRTVLDTFGLAWIIFVVTALWTIASRTSARLADRDPAARHELDRYLPALVPVVLAYTVAHYFSTLWFDTQSAIALISDPFARGADLFGTIGWQPDYRALSPALIAYVQLAAIVVGHVAAVVVTYDQAVSELSLRDAIRSQYPYLAAMVAYSVGGLLLLL